MIKRALYGIEDDGLEVGLKDDDGGFIKVQGQRAGFLANLEEPFSPDGYYTEGPYYQRYAMYPFLMSVAMGMRDGKAELYPRRSINLSDGPDVTHGGVAIL